MTDSELATLLRPHLARVVEAVKARADTSSPLTFSDGAPLPRRIGQQFSSDAVGRFADYFATDDDGRYPGCMHRRFGCDAQTFADTSQLQRKQITDKNGHKVWHWVKKDTGGGGAAPAATAPASHHVPTHPKDGAHPHEAEAHTAADATTAELAHEHPELASDPTLREKVAQVARKAALAVYWKLPPPWAPALATVGGILGDVFDVPSDMGKLGYNPNISSGTANPRVHDPVSGAINNAIGTGASGHIVASLASKIIVKALFALKGAFASKPVEMADDSGTSSSLTSAADWLADLYDAAHEACGLPPVDREVVREAVERLGADTFASLSDADLDTFAAHKDGDTWTSGDRIYTRSGGKTTWKSAKQKEKPKPEEKGAKVEKPAKEPKAAPADPTAVHAELNTILSSPETATPEAMQAITTKLKALSVDQIKAIQTERGIKGGTDKAKRVQKIIDDARAKMAGKTGADVAPTKADKTAKKTLPVKDPVAAVQKVADATTDPLAKDYIESALHNHDPAKESPADLAAALGASSEGSYIGRDGTHVTRAVAPAVRDALAAALTALGAESHGPQAGEPTTYDQRSHQAPPAGENWFPGDPVRVVRQPLVIDGKVVSRGVVTKGGDVPKAEPAKGTTPVSSPVPVAPKATAPAGHTPAGEYEGGAVVAKDPKTGDLTTHFAPGVPEQQAAKLGKVIGAAMDELKLYVEFEDGTVSLGKLVKDVKRQSPGATDSDVLAALSHLRSTRQMEGAALNEVQTLTDPTKNQTLAVAAIGDGKDAATATLWDKDRAVHFWRLAKGKTGASLAPPESAKAEPAKVEPVKVSPPVSAVPPTAPKQPEPAPAKSSPATPAPPHVQARSVLDSLGIDHSGHSDDEVVAKLKAAFAPKAEPTAKPAAKPKKEAVKKVAPVASKDVMQVASRLKSIGDAAVRDSSTPYAETLGSVKGELSGLSLKDLESLHAHMGYKSPLGAKTVAQGVERVAQNALKVAAGVQRSDA